MGKFSISAALGLAIVVITLMTIVDATLRERIQELRAAANDNDDDEPSELSAHHGRHEHHEPHQQLHAGDRIVDAIKNRGHKEAEPEQDPYSQYFDTACDFVQNYWGIDKSHIATAKVAYHYVRKNYFSSSTVAPYQEAPSFRESPMAWFKNLYGYKSTSNEAKVGCKTCPPPPVTPPTPPTTPEFPIIIIIIIIIIIVIICIIPIILLCCCGILTPLTLMGGGAAAAIPYAAEIVEMTAALLE